MYEQAAKRTGYVVNVTARKGEEILVQDRESKKTFNKIKVSPGYVEVAVTLPAGQEKAGTTPFYNAVKELSKLVQSPK